MPQKKRKKKKRRTAAQMRAFRKMLAGLHRKQGKRKNRRKNRRRTPRKIAFRLARRNSPRKRKNRTHGHKVLRISNPNVAKQVKKALAKIGYKAKIITGKLK